MSNLSYYVGHKLGKYGVVEQDVPRTSYTPSIGTQLAQKRSDLFQQVSIEGGHNDLLEQVQSMERKNEDPQFRRRPNSLMFVAKVRSEKILDQLRLWKLQAEEAAGPAGPAEPVKAETSRRTSNRTRTPRKLDPHFVKLTDKAIIDADKYEMTAEESRATHRAAKEKGSWGRRGENSAFRRDTFEDIDESNNYTDIADGTAAEEGKAAKRIRIDDVDMLDDSEVTVAEQYRDRCTRNIDRNAVVKASLARGERERVVKCKKEEQAGKDEEHEEADEEEEEEAMDTPYGSQDGSGSQNGSENDECKYENEPSEDEIPWDGESEGENDDDVELQGSDPEGKYNSDENYGRETHEIEEDGITPVVEIKVEHNDENRKVQVEHGGIFPGKGEAEEQDNGGSEVKAENHGVPPAESQSCG